MKDTINHELLPGRNIIWTPRAERTTAGLTPPGAFLVFITPPSGRGLVIPVFLFSIFLVVTCPRPPVFARPNILVASFATQSVVASFATQARACILSDHNTFYTPRGGGNGGVMPLGLFLLFSIFLVVTCPRPLVFARPNVLVASFATQARACILSDHNIFYTPRGGRERRGNAPGAFLVFWWSLAPDLRFSLGQTNTRRVFRYTGKGFYLE